MNKQQAMQEAHSLVADAVYKLAEAAAAPANYPYSPEDRERVVNALLLIANRFDSGKRRD